MQKKTTLKRFPFPHEYSGEGRGIRGHIYNSIAGGIIVPVKDTVL
jgi:hypothetical protein